jgi:hypothetical protein
MNHVFKRLVFGCSLLGVLLAGVPAVLAQKGAESKKQKPAPAAAKKSGGATQVKMEDGSKVRAYSFGALDLEGKLKTPQLLYFLNRVRVELDSTAEHRRSFIKELKATADEKGL